MARPVVALLTDFGTRDHYAGTLKGVILSVCPDATLVDIGHEIPAHDVVAGALELAACYRYFPHGTIFLVVVDPGVGSARRGIAADIGDHRFVAPDNGVLSAVFRDAPPKKVVELTERKYSRPTISRTFEGRDRFAPAAGFLAKGLAMVSLGKAITNYHSLDLPRPVVSGMELTGEVVRVDRFGNLITNLDRKAFEQFTNGAGIAVVAGDRDVARIVATYADAPRGELCALFGSTDHLEIAINAGDAAGSLQLGRGAAVRVRLVR
ncbi:MAG: SAM-dependent chlorinase/fluorinase [Vicinamibacterales bacterium]